MEIYRHTEMTLASFSTVTIDLRDMALSLDRAHVSLAYGAKL